jgi:putative hydrolase of the HAD superfamily
MRPGIEAVAFDLDGTLYPNYSLNIRLLPFALGNARLLSAFGKARAIHHSECAAAAQSDFYADQAALVAEILGEEPVAVKGKIEKLIYRGWEAHFKKIRLYSGVLETLEAFRSAGLKLGLLSDFPPEAKLEYLGIGSYWDAVLCSERIGCLKPESASFFELAKALVAEPEKILYVGNSFHYDVIGAKKAGMSAALIKRTFFSTGTSIIKKKSGLQADFVFDHYRQLCNYVLN